LTKMRAARLVAPGRVEVDVVDVPEPQPGWSLVRMHAASICGSDVHVVFDGFHPEELPSRPGYPGHEGVGEVVASPSGEHRAGELVLTVPVPSEAGCLAEYQVVADRSLIPLPAGGDRARLLLAQQLGTTIYAFRRFWSGPGGRVATVLGAGSAGLFFLQQVRQAGFEQIVVSDREPGRLEVARELGATVTVLAPAESPVEATLDLSGGAGADLVIEAAGYDVCRAQAVEAVRVSGRIGLFGFPERKGLAPFPTEAAFRKTPSVEWSSGTQMEPGLRSFREALEAIHSGRIEVDYCLSPRFPLDRAPEALQLARERGRGAVKVGVDLAAAG
jgi:L-iditol 2-dehydrogenase